MKKIVKLLFLLILIVISAGAIGLASVGQIIKTTGAEIASQALGVPVSVSGVSVDYFGKKITFEGLTIGSPEGFESPYTIQFSSIAVAARDLFVKPMVIDTVLIGPYTAYYEMNKRGNNFSSFAGKSGKGPSSSQNADAPSDKEPFPVVINLLKTEEGKIRSSATVPGQKAIDSEMTVPGVEIRNLGNKDAPVDAKIAVSELVRKISMSVMGQNPDMFFKNGEAAIRGTVENAKKTLGGALGGLLSK